jgi:hypothetical protein
MRFMLPIGSSGLFPYPVSPRPKKFIPVFFHGNLPYLTSGLQSEARFILAAGRCDQDI